MALIEDIHQIISTYGTGRRIRSEKSTGGCTKKMHCPNRGKEMPMPRHIDAHRAENLLRMCGTYHRVISFDTVIDVLHDTQTADVVERKKGKWIWLSSTYDRTPCEMRFMCSECHHETIVHSNEMASPWENYCPVCGAEMTGGDGNE